MSAVQAPPARITIVNYGMGNLRSVEKALERVGAEPLVSSDPADMLAADGLILPGVGAFPKAMSRIRELGLDRTIHEAVRHGVPLLGVCLGMQLLFESSVENEDAEGLGLLPGAVRRFDAPGLKVPHIGWAPVRIEQGSAITEGIADCESFYFVHTYAPEPAPSDLLGSAAYGSRFAALVGRHPTYGAQFHPEKSSTAGLRMLANFAGICAPVAAGA